MPNASGHDQGTADGLLLFIDNTRALHDQLRSVEKMMMEKIVSGAYSPNKAPKAFSYVTEAAAKQYVKEFAESEELWPTWNMAFPKKIRDEVDKDLANRFWDRIQVDPAYAAELAQMRESSSKGRPELPVIFRAEKSNRTGGSKGEVTAVFPTLPGTSARDFSVYAHIGQHSTGTYSWYAQTRAAKPSEYASLLAELRRIYEGAKHGAVKLRVVERFSRSYDDERRKYPQLRH